MTGDENDHEACVHAWMERAAASAPSERLIEAFELGFGAMWRRAHRTLGDVTLTAIVDRVLYTATEQYPFLSVLELDATGMRGRLLSENARNVSPQQLREGLCFVLVEFLTVLGSLTAEILTPALHDELSKVAPPEKAPDEEERSQDGETNPEIKDVEGVKP